ncbi:hypothetical protein Vadar_023333 [Vaccinium darrowii]|uniref:Uncharacterized protein n=1 Tax=Vaccinium darrowii TaxID=229202 RepID=A0ACB7X3K1_9ERIC|nr:hypothetical protein Vadar_023333 [Vaccinium darrowii]
MEARQYLDSLQSLCSQNLGDDSLKIQEQEALRQFMELSATKESFKIQKSRVAWLALGDKNTKFFHHKVASNRMRNKILSLTNAKGVRLEKPEDVQQEIVQFYMGLLGTKFQNKQDAKVCLQQIIRRKVPVSMQRDLI